MTLLPNHYAWVPRGQTETREGARRDTVESALAVRSRTGKGGEHGKGRVNLHCTKGLSHSTVMAERR